MGQLEAAFQLYFYLYAAQKSLRHFSIPAFFCLGVRSDGCLMEKLSVF